MPTMKPRVQVTMTPHQFEIVKRLARLQGRSRGAVVLDLVEAVEPVLERTVLLLERAAVAKNGIAEGLKQSAERAEADLMPFVAAAMGNVDLFFTEAENAIDRASGAGAPPATRPGAKRSNPRPSNHGGQVSDKPLKTKKTGGLQK